MTKIDTTINEISDSSIFKAFEELEKASGEFEHHKETYLGQDSIRAIKRSLKNKGFYEFVFNHFHTNYSDINFKINLLICKSQEKF